jgi:hypothetical protein
MMKKYRAYDFDNSMDLWMKNLINAVFMHTESLCLKDPVTSKLWLLVASFVIVFMVLKESPSDDVK